jgi:hypothetical protein
MRFVKSKAKKLVMRPPLEMYLLSVFSVILCLRGEEHTGLGTQP